MPYEKGPLSKAAVMSLASSRRRLGPIHLASIALDPASDVPLAPSALLRHPRGHSGIPRPARDAPSFLAHARQGPRRLAQHGHGGVRAAPCRGLYQRARRRRLLRQPGAARGCCSTPAPRRSASGVGATRRPARRGGVGTGRAGPRRRPAAPFRPGPARARRFSLRGMVAAPRQALARAARRASSSAATRWAGGRCARPSPPISARARAVTCGPDQVIIVSGAQQALDLTARVLIDPTIPCGSRIRAIRACAGPSSPAVPGWFRCRSTPRASRSPGVATGHPGRAWPASRPRTSTPWASHEPRPAPRASRVGAGGRTPSCSRTTTTASIATRAARWPRCRVSMPTAASSMSAR